MNNLTAKIHNKFILYLQNTIYFRLLMWYNTSTKEKKKVNKDYKMRERKNLWATTLLII
jgi:hypothetical protein